jgi:hypothetical protein
VRRLRGSEGEREGWDMNRRGSGGSGKVSPHGGWGWLVYGICWVICSVGIWIWKAPQSGCFFEVLIIGSQGISVQTLTF